MLERHVSEAAVFGPLEDISPESRQTLRDSLPKGTARRLTPVSLALSAVTRNARISPEDEIVFGTSYSGCVSLEQYLQSFPSPSPASFQNSVHAGILESVLVARHLPICRLQCLANPPDTLLAASLRSALLSETPVVHLLLAEECGNWLRDENLAADHTFACYLRLTREPPPSQLNTGKLSWGHTAPEASVSPSTPSPDYLCEIISQRQSLHLPTHAGAFLTLTWHP